MPRVHHRLDVWKRSIDFAEGIYKAASSFPKFEEYGLGSQIRRAAISIPSNIAEGAARRSKREFTQFLYVASGSASEVDTHIELASRLGYLSRETKSKLDTELEAISKMLSSLIRSQKRDEL